MTNSLSFPNLFDVARNRVGVLNDEASVANRSKLLILTEPTELYNNPNFGVGLKQHLWHYNDSPNERSIIQNKIKDQLELHEPCCTAEDTEFDDKLTSIDESEQNNPNELDLSVFIHTNFGKIAEVDIDE